MLRKITRDAIGLYEIEDSFVSGSAHRLLKTGHLANGQIIGVADRLVLQDQGSPQKFRIDDLYFADETRLNRPMEQFSVFQEEDSC